MQISQYYGTIFYISIAFLFLLIVFIHKKTKNRQTPARTKITSSLEKIQKNAATSPAQAGKIILEKPLHNFTQILSEARKNAVQEVRDKSLEHIKSIASIKHHGAFYENNAHKKHTVLIVDDSKSALVYAKRILEKTYKILTASNGVEALQILEKQTPDLIITDVDMPKMDGFELVKRVRQRKETIQTPIIMMTGHVHLHVAIGAQEGINGFLAKPYPEQDLLEQSAYLLTE